MRRTGPIIAAVACAFALVALLVYGVVSRGDDTTLDAAVQRGERPIAPAADRRLPVLGGQGDKALADLRGKVVVVNFWASWCGPCEDEAPALERAQKRLAATGGTVIGVTYKDTTSESLDFVRRFGLTYPNLEDGRLALAPEFGTRKLPETFVLDRSGRVVAMSRGQITDAFLDRWIAEAGKT